MIDDNEDMLNSISLWLEMSEFDFKFQEISCSKIAIRSDQ